MVTPEEREWMWNEYAPEPRMRLNLGIRRRLAPLLDNDRRKIELANSLLFTMPGTPIIYYGDEIGMGDNIWLDDRNGVRTPMQWSSGANAGFSSATPEKLYNLVIDTPPYSPEPVNVAAQMKDPDSLFNFTCKLIAIVKQHMAFGEGNFEWARCENTAIATYFRTYTDDDSSERILVVQNLSGEPQEAVIVLPEKTAPALIDLLTGELVPVSSEEDFNLHVQMKPYGYCWLEV